MGSFSNGEFYMAAYSPHPLGNGFSSALVISEPVPTDTSKSVDVLM